MRVAIVHYWFLGAGGGEKVIEALAAMYPEADIYCLFADKQNLPPGVSKERLHCSILDKIPFSHRLNRMIFPLYAGAVGAFDFSKYDLIISSDSPSIKGIVPPIDTVHISYCHTPGRFLWDLAPAFTAKLPWLARPVFAEMASNARVSDFVAAQRVDYLIANSHYIARRIRKYYRREPAVIYPPVEAAAGYLPTGQDDYYLSVGRMIKNKRIDVLIDACNRLKRRLVIVGGGRDEKVLKAMAGPTIEFLGRVSSDELGKLYSRCRAFLFAADEDFGIVAVEAQAFGRPVIAYGHGGSLETVRVDDPQGRLDTGLLFPEQTPECLADAMQRFETQEERFVPSVIREHALSFDVSVFKEKMSEFVSFAMMARETPAPVLAMPRRPMDTRAAAWNEIRGQA